MTAPDGGVRPAVNRPATESTVAEPTDIGRAQRIAAYRARQREIARIALDRHIALAYGPQHVRRWAA